MTTPAIRLLEERLRSASRNIEWLRSQRDEYQRKVDNFDRQVSDKLEEIQDLEEAIRALSYPEGAGS